MNRRAQCLRDFAIATAFALSPVLTVAAVILGIFWLLFGMDACISTTRSKMSVAGLEFQVDETDCDTLAKDASISVYGLEPKQTRKTLLFKYSPGRDVLPAVTAPDASTLRISVPDVADVTFREHTWMNRSIEYQIGQMLETSSPTGRLDY